MRKEFFKYVSRNVAGMLGISAYLLADTFFISLYSGANGITVLNLALPVYGLIFALGAMVGIGSATSHAIKKAQGVKNIDSYFTHSLIWQIIFSIPFILTGLLASEKLLVLMGADHTIATLGKSYLQIALMASPFFMANFTFTTFVRNDNAPTTAMVAAIVSSLFNIAFDYIFMFPLDLGLTGAALATGVSPVISILICSLHYRSKKSTMQIKFRPPSFKLLFSCCKLGVSAFVGEISSAITTAVFNTLILSSSGNVGVAAYGIVANLSLIAMSIFNGVSQGMQPLLSRCYGQGKSAELKQLLKLGVITCVVLEGIIIAAAWCFTNQLVAIFNSEQNTQLAEYAHTALRLYFLGYSFAGINILLVTYFSSTYKAIRATVASLLRGAVAIVVCALVMNALWGLNGVWLSFSGAELITFFVAIFLLRYKPERI
ncbi:MAG: MATE family efflux transporter [Acutalibacteraceae bacterium]|nr:MATE family efflux transporter [Acutalibacteraceae bacterium]